ncbi:hypothetical protein QVL82_21080, partial [Cellulosimicrobium funkei]
MFLPAAYDLLWSVVALAVLAGVGALVVLVVRALTREPAPALHGLADGDPVRRAARRHATTVSVAAATAAALVGAVLVQAVTTAVGGLAEGVLVGLSPALVGLAFLGAHAVGERTWPRQRTAVRAATL